MKSKSRSKQSSVVSARAIPRQPVVPRLPVEVTEMCLRFSAQLSRSHSPLAGLKQLGSLRLVSRHFLDVFTKELFNSVTLCLVPVEGRPTAFLDIVHKNTKILKHIRHLTIQLSDTWQNYLGSTGVVQACAVVRVFSQAPLTTLSIEGLDKDLQCPPIFNALHALRSTRTLQTLNISGSAIPPFLVCGHFSSTRLKCIDFSTQFNYPFPGKLTNENLELEGGLSIGPDSVLATAFQPFANIEELNVPNGVDIPEYFPLQDFGSAHYPSNGRIPFTLPALRRLQVGHPDEIDDACRLDAEDYKVLGSLLSRAPRLESLCIIDEFWRHDGLSDLTPFLDQLSSLKNLNSLALVDNNNKRDEVINAISSILGAFPPVPSLKTLRITFQWLMWNADATRASLYFSEAWKKLQRALMNPALASLQVLMLDIKIRIWSEDEVPETFGPEEVDGFEEALVDLYSRDGELEVIVDIEVEDT